MKHEKAFKDFLSNEVNLNQTRLDTLDNHVDAVTEVLSNMKGFESYEKQGSYATGTIIKPVGDKDQYDADLILMMEEDPDTYSSPKTYLDGVLNHLKSHGTYEDKVSRKTRCVRVNYESDCHLDLVPCVDRHNGLYICNWKTDNWEITDGNGYKNWFLDKNRKTKGNLRRVTRLVKFLRDHKNTFTAPSIILTTLLGQAIQQYESEQNFTTIAGTLDLLTTRVSEFLKANTKIPTISNPALPEEPFSSPQNNRHWDETQYKNFRNQFISLSGRISEAVAEEDIDKSIKLWQNIFGGKFVLPKTNKNSSSSAIVYPPTYSKSVRVSKPYSLISPSLADTDSTAYSRLNLSEEEISEIKTIFPKLECDISSGLIYGEIDFEGFYEKNARSSITFEIGSNGGLNHRRLLKNFIEDSYHIEINLFEINPFDHLPFVKETGGRVEKISRNIQCSKIDLHIFKDNTLCLGLDNSLDHKIGIIEFIQELIIPFLYRLSYADKFGLKATKDNLWGEYSHGPAGISEYNSEVSRKNGRNKPCPCGSELKYKHCHIDYLPFD